jgi:ketosteroid isomerase-like protein
MRLAAFCCILCLTACTKAPPPDTHDADVKAIKDVESAWVKTAATKDVDAFVAYYADEASVLMPNAPIFTGKPAIKESLKPLMSDPNFSITFMPTRVEVAKSGDLGFTQGPYKMSFSDQRGNKFEDEGKYLTVWRKVADGTWKAVEDTFMSDLPLPPPPN